MRVLKSLAVDLEFLPSNLKMTDAISVEITISYKPVVVPANVSIFKHGELISREQQVFKKLVAYKCKSSSW